MSAGSGRPAEWLAGAWASALVVLAGLWIRSPFTGPGPMFLAWTVVAAPLAAWSWNRFRLWNVRQVPRSVLFLTGLAVAWAAVAALAASELAAEMALDGLVMRNAPQRLIGRGLQWLPGLFGLALSVAGLAAALEARYRIRHGEAGGTP